MIDSVLFNLHMMTNGRLNEWRKFPTVKELFEDYLTVNIFMCFPRNASPEKFGTCEKNGRDGVREFQD